MNMKDTVVNANPPPGSHLLTAEEVRRRLRLPLSTVYHLAKIGKLPAVQFGRSWRFPAASIEQMTEVTPLKQAAFSPDKSAVPQKDLISQKKQTQAKVD